ncbi:MAG: hypothetical protein WAS01_07905, partial [Nostocoides sp.]
MLSDPPATKDKARKAVSDAATSLSDRAVPAVEVARERAAAAREAAQAGMEAAAPRVESARSALVDEVLPKVAGALASVAAGALAAKDQAADAA